MELSGENATAQTQSVCPLSIPFAFHVPTSQSRTTLSAPAEASVLPSGENATAATQPSCLRTTAGFSPDSAMGANAAITIIGKRNLMNSLQYSVLSTQY